MSWLKTLWGLLFRLFPCPTRTGLRRVGRPGRDSPVLVTANFHLTVHRLTRTLRRAGVDAWLLVADSRGVNVWCAAGGEELNTESVSAVLKTSGVAREVDHRRVILPPLAAPGVCASELRARTEWNPRWGPVRAGDLPAYLAAGQRATEPMRRVTWSWFERLDPALGTYFVALPLGALGFALIAPHLLPSFVVVSSASFVLFFLVAPWLPGRSGTAKTGWALLLLGLCFAGLELWQARGGPHLRAEGIIALVCVALYGMELGGLAPHLPSGFDPLMARLGVDRLGNTRFAGTVRTDLLLGRRALTLDPERCLRCRTCQRICPVGVWARAGDGRARMAQPERCTACTACIKQCEPEAITAPYADRSQQPADREP
jgi:NAD-dependent dihydropyrimidine dehydrogenase PreA subunit